MVVVAGLSSTLALSVLGEGGEGSGHGHTSLTRGGVIASQPRRSLRAHSPLTHHPLSPPAVVIEMLNAMNALSETHSILEVPPWVNPYLCLAIVGR